MTTKAPLNMPTHRDSSNVALNPVIENKSQLVDFLAAGCKSHGLFRLGAEQ